MVHLGIIPDGNRRWCKENNYEPKNLIKLWQDKFIELVKEIIAIKKNKYKYLQKVEELSFYICSIDNVNRDDDTKKYIYKFIENFKIIYDNKELYFDKKQIEYFESLKNNFNIVINFIGELDLLPDSIKCIINEINQITTYNKNENNKTLKINLAFAYDYKKDLYNYRVNDNKNYNREQSDIDILFRSGKEKRISGFFPTKIIYSELFFSNKYWPDIKLNDLNETIKKFYKRNRRYGK